MPPQGRCEWSDEQRLRLIDLVEQFEVIWAPLNAADKIKVAASRRAVFEQIQHHFGEEGFSVEEMAAQWRNLKDIFYKKLKELNRRRIGAGQQTSKPTWRFFEPLSFLASDRAMDKQRKGIFGECLIHSSSASESKAEEVDGEGGGNGSLGNILEEMLGENSGGMMVMKEEQREEDEEEARKKREEEERRTVKRVRGVKRVAEKQTVNQHQPQIRRKNPIAESADWHRSSRLHHHFAPSNCSFRPLPPPSSHIRPPPVSPSSAAYPPNFAFPLEMCSSASLSSRPTLTPTAAGDIQQQLKPKLLNGTNGSDRFKFFGAFVESAVRDLHHQCPDIAFRLLHGIYATIAQHQMEATTTMLGGGGGDRHGMGMMETMEEGGGGEKEEEEGGQREEEGEEGRMMMMMNCAAGWKRSIGRGERWKEAGGQQKRYNERTMTE